MKTYHLNLITPIGRLLDGEVESLVAPGVEGSFGVLADHTPIVAALETGVIKIKTAQQQGRYFALTAGIFEMDSQKRALLLLDQAAECGTLAGAFDKVNELKKAKKGV